MKKFLSVIVLGVLFACSSHAQPVLTASKIGNRLLRVQNESEARDILGIVSTNAGTLLLPDGVTTRSNANGTISASVSVDVNTDQFGPDASRISLFNGASLPGFVVQKPALSLVSTQANFTESFIQGMAYNGSARYIFCTDAIVATGAKTNSSAATGTFTERTYNHLGDGDYFDGNLYVPVQSWQGCGSSSNLSVGIFDSATLEGKNIVHVDSDGLPEISCAAVDADASVLYLASFCDGSKILKYSISSGTNLTFLGAVPLSATVTSVQGSSVKDGILYLSGGTMPTVKIYAIDPATGETQTMVSTNLATTEVEGVAITNGMVQCYVVGVGPVMLSVTNSEAFRVSKLSGAAVSQNSTNYFFSTNSGIDDGLVVYYPFSETSGASVVDHSGDGVTGELDSTTVRTNVGLFGRGLYVDGVNRLTASSSSKISGLSNLTVAIWCKRQLSGGTVALCQKHGGGTDGEFFLNSAGNSTLQFTTVNASSSRVNLAITGSLPAMNDSRWHFIAGTYDGATMRLWLDGLCVGTAAQTGALKSTAWPLVVGGDNSIWQGELDEFRMFDRALRTNEIISLWESGGVGITTNLNVVAGATTNVFKFVNGKLSSVQ